MSKIGRFGSEKNNKKIAQKQERELAEELNGTATPNSGAIDGFAGDVRLANYLVEAKHTEAKSFILGLIDLGKITREAIENDKEPMMIIKFFKAPLGCDAEWCIIPKRVLKERGFFDDDK